MTVAVNILWLRLVRKIHWLSLGKANCVWVTTMKMFSGTQQKLLCGLVVLLYLLAGF